MSNLYEIKTLDDLEKFFFREKAMCTECVGVRPHYQEIVRVTFLHWVKEPFNGVVESNFPGHTSATLHFKIRYGQKLFNLLYIYAQHDESSRMHYRYEAPADPHKWDEAGCMIQRKELDEALQRFRKPNRKSIEINRIFTVDNCLKCIGMMADFARQIRA